MSNSAVNRTWGLYYKGTFFQNEYKRLLEYRLQCINQLILKSRDRSKKRAFSRGLHCRLPPGVSWAARGQKVYETIPKRRRSAGGRGYSSPQTRHGSPVTGGDNGLWAEAICHFWSIKEQARGWSAVPYCSDHEGGDSTTAGSRSSPPGDKDPKRLAGRELPLREQESNIHCVKFLESGAC